MKTLLLLLALTTLASCGKSSSEKDSYKNALNGDGKLHAKIETSIWKSENSFEMLSNESSSESINVDGEEFYCSLKTLSGTETYYSINGSKLTLSLGSGELVLDRVSGSGNTLNGSWSIKEKDKNATTITTFTFADDKLTINLTCKF